MRSIEGLAAEPPEDYERRHEQEAEPLRPRALADVRS
jgi:hypothetical protein